MAIPNSSQPTAQATLSRELEADERFRSYRDELGIPDHPSKKKNL